jgi:polyisoprenoid-binding protein YceI
VSKVAAGTYKLEPDHTQVLFTFNHLGLPIIPGNSFSRPAV